MSSFSNSPSVKSDRARPGWLAVALAGAAFVLGGYAFGYVNDVEGFNATSLTTTLFVKAVAQGDNPFWTDLLGLGLPQPFRISLIQHPLGFLFALLPPLAAIKTIVVLQGLAGTLVCYVLCRRLRMPAFVAGACALSFILCTSVLQPLFFDDWPTSFLSFCFLPLLTWLFVLLCEEQSPYRALGLGIALGLASGLLFATGIASLVLPYLLVLSIVFCCPPDVVRRHWRPIAFGAVTCALVASAVFVLLASEYLQFPASAVRDRHSNPGLLTHAASALMLQYGDARSISEFAQLVLQDGHRTVGFGPIAAVATLLALIFPLGPFGLRVKFAFIASLVFMVLPPEVYGSVMTATWVFRDGANFFGILLFGLLLSRVVEIEREGALRLAPMLCLAQCLILFVAALPPWYRTVENGLDPTLRPNNLSALEREGPFFRQLREITGPVQGRLMMSGDLGRAVREYKLFRDGLVANIGALHGWRIVNAFPRGIATSALHPDAHLMEGTINATERNIREKDFLDILGIDYVLAWESETVAAVLRRVGTIRLPGQDDIAVWHNPDAWAPVVELKREARNRQLPLNAGCGHDRFLCADFTPVRELRGDSRVTSAMQRGGTIAFSVQPVASDRLFLVNSWYRPGWSADRADVGVVPLFGQLIGVIVPAGVAEVALTYQPPAVMWAYVVSTAAIVIAALLILLLMRAPHRSARRAQAPNSVRSAVK